MIIILTKKYKYYFNIALLIKSIKNIIMGLSPVLIPLIGIYLLNILLQIF